MENKKNQTPELESISSINKALDKVKQGLYYIIIFIISFVALVFLPMIGSTVGLQWNIPNTSVGWIVWVGARLIISTINVLIFYSFLQQGRLNVIKNPKYQEAMEILGKNKVKNYMPKSPAKWQRDQYLKKGTTLFISTALATVALSQAILAYDWTALLAYLFTIIMGLVFGLLQMKKAEEYWSEEFYNYAKLMEEKLKEEKENKKEIEKEEINEIKEIE